MILIQRFKSVYIYTSLVEWFIYKFPRNGNKMCLEEWGLKGCDFVVNNSNVLQIPQPKTLTANFLFWFSILAVLSIIISHLSHQSSSTSFICCIATGIWTSRCQIMYNSIGISDYHVATTFENEANRDILLSANLPELTWVDRSYILW